MTEAPDDLQRWLDVLTETLGLEPSFLDAVSGPVLDRVRDVAHEVVRSGAPLTAFAVGLAAGIGARDVDGADLAARVEQGLSSVDRLVNQWPHDRTER